MVHVAILGFGTVGSGVAEVLETNEERIRRNAATGFELKYILDVRDFPGHPYASRFIKDFAIIEQDPDVRVVVETIGGTGVAYDFTKRCLLAGKDVVTSNKELVATHGCELLAIAKEKNLNYLFEASVGGGIPIIRPISQCLAANELDEIYGILNGTSNYVLTQMIANGLSLETAVKQAQDNGYAEADPTADIEGHDAARKICILASLSFGRHIYPDLVPTEGITNVTLEDVSIAWNAGYKIKLLGRGLRVSNDKVSCYVAPHLIRKESLLGNVEDVNNAIVVRGNAIGSVMFYGAGAGKLPTASAVVADIIDCAKHFKARKYIDWEEGGPSVFADPDTLKTRWYLRVPAGSGEVLETVSDAEVLDEKNGGTAFLTGEMDAKAARALAGKLSAASIFRLLED